MICNKCNEAYDCLCDDGLCVDCHCDHTNDNQAKQSKITNEQFDNELIKILSAENINIIIVIPGVYELLAEHYNNQVIDNILNKGN